MSELLLRFFFFPSLSSYLSFRGVFRNSFLFFSFPFYLPTYLPTWRAVGAHDVEKPQAANVWRSAPPAQVGEAQVPRPPQAQVAHGLEERRMKSRLVARRRILDENFAQ